MAKTKHTVLVLADTGKVSAIQVGEGTWGKKERPPIFEHIEIDATPEIVEWIQKNGRYDFDTTQFVNRTTGESFSETDDLITNDIEYDNRQERTVDLARGLGLPITQQSCDFLRASHIDGDDRVYWLHKFYPLRKETGVKDLLKATKKGLYPDVRAAFDALDDDVKIKIIECGDEQDKTYMEWFGFTKLEA